MKKLSSILAFLFLISAGPVTGSAQNAAAVEPQLVYKALQDKDCRHWVDSVMDRLSFKEKSRAVIYLYHRSCGYQTKSGIAA